MAIPTRDRRELALAAARTIAPELGDDDELLLVDNGSTDGTGDAARALFVAEIPAGRVVAEPEGGISTARNRALREARHGVVCFVDDDVRVEEGWLAALRGAWVRARDSVACIGGPIHPVWGAPRPAWLVDQLLYVVAALDLGPQGKRLDQSPAVGYVWGGNFSVRAEAVLSVGGFDPDRGQRPGARWDRGEEEAVQRRLAGAGFEVWYEPAAAVGHLIPPARLTKDSFSEFFRARGRSEAVRRTDSLAAAGALGRACVTYAVMRGRRNPAAPAARFRCSYAWARLRASVQPAPIRL